MLYDVLVAARETTTSRSASLNDPHVRKALRLMHEHPVRDWTVEDLAREAA